MKIIITDERKVFAIQQEFHEKYPFLKLEFFSKSIINGGTSKITHNPTKTIAQCRTIHKVGMLTITPQMTVTDLKQNFCDIYGLSIQVLRQSGKAWLDTTLTEGWTLEMQNKQGKELSAPGLV